MNRHISRLLLILTSINISCKNNSNNNISSNVETIDFNFGQATEVFDLKTIFDTSSYQTINLETNEDCYIGEVTKMFFHHDTIFIVDKMSKSIFLFNDKGQYLSKICRIGRGRQEYMDLSDVFIANNHILVMDKYQFKVCCYDFNGEYRYGFDSKEGIRIAEYGGTIFVCTTWSGGSLWENHKMMKFDTTGHLISSYFKMHNNDKELNDFSYDYFITKTNGLDILLTSKNIVYSFKNGDLVPSYRINFGEYEMPEKIASKGMSYILSNKYNEKYTLGVYKIMEIDNYRFIFSRLGFSYINIYDIYNKETLITCLYTKMDDFFIFLMNGFIYDNQMFFYYSGDLLCDFKNGIWAGKIPHGFPGELYKASKGIVDTDNGVIIKMKLKNND